MKKTYTIPTLKLEVFKKRINKMSNKAKKLGLEPFTVEYLGEEVITKKVGKKKYTISYTTIAVEGEAPTIQGFNLIAMLERFNGENIVKRFNFTDEELAEKQIDVKELAHRTTECNHCNSNRARKYIMILENVETGEIIQVGKACLKDYTNSNYSAEQIASYYEEFDIISELENDDDDFFCGIQYYQAHYSLDEILAISIEFIETHGYSNSNAFMPTKQHVSNYMFEKDKHQDYREMESSDVLMEKHAKKMQAVKEFFEAEKDTSDYIHNLKVLLKSKYIEYKHFGYVVSAYASYMRALEKLNGTWEKIKAERELERANKEREKAENLSSVFVGEIGQRDTFNLKYTKHLTFENIYGVSFMYFFKDENNNVFLWTTNKDLELESGEQIELVGTIKDHKEYRDVKQTVITRCKIK